MIGVDFAVLGDCLCAATANEVKDKLVSGAMPISSAPSILGGHIESPRRIEPGQELEITVYCYSRGQVDDFLGEDTVRRR